jgi:hypothetical protein
VGRKESLQTALANYVSQVAANKLRMKAIKTMHPVTWFLRPQYWKADARHHKAFKNVIIARRMIATDEANGR